MEIKKKIKQLLFLRKLNKAIKGYGAKASYHLNDYLLFDKLHIQMRKFYCTYPMFHFKDKSTQEIIDFVIKELKIQNVKEAYE